MVSVPCKTCTSARWLTIDFLTPCVLHLPTKSQTSTISRSWNRTLVLFAPHWGRPQVTSAASKQTGRWRAGLSHDKGDLCPYGNKSCVPPGNHRAVTADGRKGPRCCHDLFHVHKPFLHVKVRSNPKQKANTTCSGELLLVLSPYPLNSRKGRDRVHSR